MVRGEKEGVLEVTKVKGSFRGRGREMEVARLKREKIRDRSSNKSLKVSTYVINSKYAKKLLFYFR